MPGMEEQHAYSLLAESFKCRHRSADHCERQKTGKTPLSVGHEACGKPVSEENTNAPKRLPALSQAGVDLGLLKGKQLNLKLPPAPKPCGKPLPVAGTPLAEGFSGGDIRSHEATHQT